MSRTRLPLLAAAMVLPGLLAAPQARGAGLCVFDGASYSEGARICAEPGLMMTCSVSGDRAIWTVATDKDLSGVCAGSSRRGARRMERRKAARRAAAEPAAPTADATPKCFTFAGKRYCE
jgi:hypothetical protein